MGARARMCPHLPAGCARSICICSATLRRALASAPSQPAHLHALSCSSDTCASPHAQYPATILDCGQKSARVRFDAFDGLEHMASSFGVDIHEPAANGLAPNAMGECWVVFESLRPCPPETPPNFDELITLGCLLEMAAEGGWWEVEVLGASGGPLGEPDTTNLVCELDEEDGPQAAPAASAGGAADGAASGSASGAEAAADEEGPAPDVAATAAEEQALAEGATPAAAALAGATAAAKAQAERAAAARRRATAAREAVERVKAGVGAGTCAAPAEGATSESTGTVGAAAGAAARVDAPITYTVRLLNAPSEFVGLYDGVRLEDLRPGWQWKSGRWAGRWAHGYMTKAEEGKLNRLGLKKLLTADELADGGGGGGVSPGRAAGAAEATAKRARKSGGGGGGGAKAGAAKVAPKAAIVSEAEQALIFSRIQEKWPLGKKVEVVQSDAGLTGAWFEGEIIGYRMPDQCVVRYDELHEGDDSEDEGGEAKAAAPAAAPDGGANGTANGSPTAPRMKSAPENKDEAAANGSANGTPTAPRMKSAPENKDEAKGAGAGGGEVVSGSTLGGHYGKWDGDAFEFPPLYECAESASRLRPLPPPVAGDASDSHLAWAIGLQPGAALDLKYDGGWWEVELIHVWHIPASSAGATSPGGVGASSGATDGATDHADSAAGGGTPAKGPAEASYRFTVKAVDFDVEHVVTASSLRPPYNWLAETSAWRLRPPPGVYINDGKAASTSGGTKAKKSTQKKKPTGKAGAGAILSEAGEPSASAAQFTVGTKRKGVDGRLWEVDLRGQTPVWVAEKAPGGGQSRSRKRPLE